MDHFCWNETPKAHVCRYCSSTIVPREGADLSVETRVSSFLRRSQLDLILRSDFHLAECSRTAVLQVIWQGSGGYGFILSAGPRKEKPHANQEVIPSWRRSKSVPRGSLLFSVHKLVSGRTNVHPLLLLLLHFYFQNPLWCHKGYRWTSQARDHTTGKVLASPLDSGKRDTQVAQDECSHHLHQRTEAIYFQPHWRIRTYLTFFDIWQKQQYWMEFFQPTVNLTFPKVTQKHSNTFKIVLFLLQTITQSFKLFWQKSRALLDVLESKIILWTHILQVFLLLATIFIISSSLGCEKRH